MWAGITRRLPPFVPPLLPPPLPARSYYGNRAPYGLYIHTPWLTPDNIQAANNFLEYALGLNNTWVVTVRQVIEWMQASAHACPVCVGGVGWEVEGWGPQRWGLPPSFRLPLPLPGVAVAATAPCACMPPPALLCSALPWVPEQSLGLMRHPCRTRCLPARWTTGSPAGLWTSPRLPVSSAAQRSRSV